MGKPDAQGQLGQRGEIGPVNLHSASRIALKHLQMLKDSFRM